MMKAIVHNSCCHIFRREQLPRGTVGKTMEAEFSADWDGLAITAVFEAGDVKMDRVYTGEPITIPHEVLATAGLSVMLGFHGALPDGTIVKRTVPEWLNNVRDSLDPSGAIGSDPTPDWTAQVQNIATEAKNVAESVRADADAGKFNGATGPAGTAGGWYTPAVTQPDANTMRVSFEPSKEGMPAVADTDVKLPAGGGDSVPKPPVGAQSDWNQNDEAAPDYVKNRPFYTGDPVETVLVEESTVTFADNHGLYMAQFPSAFEATVGETYKVSWDGATYECACINSDDRLLIGNLSIIGAGSDTGEPFLIGVVNGKKIQIITADTSASHTISISGFVQEVVKIDKKYLPKGLIVNVVGTESNFGNTYLLFDKTDEEIYNAVDNGITVTLDLFGSNLQYIESLDKTFYGIVPYTVGSNGITKLKVSYVSRVSIGWILKETYITASTASNS